MGKKKPFIDKKKSTTYSLIYRSQDDAQADPEGSDRILQPTDSVGVPDVQTEQVGRWPPGHPLAWLQAERANRVTDDARRREIVSLGLPDDGYDYMKHLRIVGGPGSTSLAQVPQSSESSRRLKEGIELVDEDATGPSIFVPATRHKQVAVRDEKMVDATQLVLRSQAADDVRP